MLVPELAALSIYGNVPNLWLVSVAKLAKCRTTLSAECVTDPRLILA